jgi:hypothetical protein
MLMEDNNAVMPTFVTFTPSEKADIKDYNKAHLSWKIECGKACQLLKDSLSAPVLERLLKDFPNHVSADETMVRAMYNSLHERYGAYTRSMDVKNRSDIQNLSATRWQDVEQAYVQYQMLCRERDTWSTPERSYSIRGHEQVTWILELIQDIPELQLTQLTLTVRNAIPDAVSMSDCVSAIEVNLRDLTARHGIHNPKESDILHNDSVAMYSNSARTKKHYQTSITRPDTPNKNITCYKCGNTGHKAPQCRVTARKEGYTPPQRPIYQANKESPRKRKGEDNSTKAAYFEKRAREVREELNQVELAMSECYSAINREENGSDDSTSIVPEIQETESDTN